MDVFGRIRQIARNNPKRIVLPEGAEDRVIEAAGQIAREGIARIILLGDEDEIARKIHRFHLREGACEALNPHRPGTLERYAAAYCELRKHKGITLEQAKAVVADNVIFPAALMVRLNEADGFVAGAAHTTRDVAKAAIHCIGPGADVRTVSSFFIMITKDKHYGENGVFLFSDCAVVPDPNASQLCDIAISTARIARELLGLEPRVAMLSYSTKGSGAGSSLERVVEATKLVKGHSPDLVVDGELQGDAAIEPAVAAIKCPTSSVKGRANILIFPDLNSGNIAYKLCQRLGGMKAIGPFLQGLAKPASDLSRGCSPSDIVDAVAVVATQAK